MSQKLQTCSRVRLLLDNSRIYPCCVGISSDIWSDVQRDISKLTRVCIYDRAGLGFSDRPVTSTLTGRLCVCVPHHCHFILISAYVCIMGELQIFLSRTLQSLTAVIAPLWCGHKVIRFILFMLFVTFSTIIAPVPESE